MPDKMKDVISLNVLAVREVRGGKIVSAENGSITIAYGQLPYYLKAARGEYGNQPLVFKIPPDEIQFKDRVVEFDGERLRLMCSLGPDGTLAGGYICGGPTAQFIAEAEEILAARDYVPKRMQVHTLDGNGWRIPK